MFTLCMVSLALAIAFQLQSFSEISLSIYTNLPSRLSQYIRAPKSIQQILGICAICPIQAILSMLHYQLLKVSLCLKIIPIPVPPPTLLLANRKTSWKRKTSETSIEVGTPKPLLLSRETLKGVSLRQINFPSNNHAERTMKILSPLYRTAVKAVKCCPTTSPKPASLLYIPLSNCQTQMLGSWCDKFQKTGGRCLLSGQTLKYGRNFRVERGQEASATLVFYDQIAARVLEIIRESLPNEEELGMKFTFQKELNHQPRDDRRLPSLSCPSCIGPGFQVGIEV
jgi:hypothetical protein